MAIAMMESVRLTEEQHQLGIDCQSFVDVVAPFSERQFTQQQDGKWSVAEVVQHLYLSARPVSRLLTGPRGVLLQWGRAEASPRSFDELTTTYQTVLATGVKAPSLFVPRPEDMQVDKSTLLERFTCVYQTIIDDLSNWSETELDEYVIPHPAFGKLTVREMLYFISVHTQHHLRLLPKA